MLTPDFIPRFSFAVDFWETQMTNAITNITYQNDAIQGLCLASAPAYDSTVLLRWRSGRSRIRPIPIT